MRKRSSILDPVKTSIIIERDLKTFADDKALSLSEEIDKALRARWKFHIKNVDPTLHENRLKVQELNELIDEFTQKRDGLLEVMEYLAKKRDNFLAPVESVDKEVRE